MTNPLLADWTTPFQIAPFDQINDDDFAPAFETALKPHKAEIEAIVEQEIGGMKLHYVAIVISNVLRKNSAVEHQTLGTAIHDLIREQHGLE